MNGSGDTNPTPGLFVVFVKDYRGKKPMQQQEEHIAVLPRVGEFVHLLPSPVYSFSEEFKVGRVGHYPDHTKYDAAVYLEATDFTNPGEWS